jgi:hypothetical protein
LYALGSARAERRFERRIGGLAVVKSIARMADVPCVEERSYERSPLVLDSEAGLLARAVTSLMVLGHYPLYAVDVDELILHARERREHVGGLLLPAVSACEWWPMVRKRVVEPLGLVPHSVLPVGAQLSEADAQTLHCDGLRWTLAGPFTPMELRFAVSMVLSESDPNELRLETRVPCSIEVEVESQSRVHTAQLTDLSTGGGFVTLTHPHPEGSPLVLRGMLCGRPVALRASVAWRTGSRTPSWRDRGMGVAFERIELATFDLLRQQIDRSLDRFRICARNGASSD